MIFKNPYSLVNTNDQLKSFWHKMCSFTQHPSDSAGEELSTYIYHPKWICRYRPATDETINALKTNTLYFTKAMYFDDPFDTFLQINLNNLTQSFLANFETKDNMSLFPADFKQICDQLKLVNASQANIISTLASSNSSGSANITFDTIQEDLNFLNSTFRSKLQKELSFICFSEDCLNEALWLKYADNHKGFALVFKFSDTPYCNESDDCLDFPSNLYPVYYSDEDTYDATNFAQYLFVQDVSMRLGVDLLSTLSEEKQKQLKPKSWEVECISLIKKKCHQYDREWRIIHHSTEQKPYIKIKPYAVVLGLNTPEDRQKSIVSSAKEAKIKHIFKTAILANNQLVAIPLHQEN